MAVSGAGGLLRDINRYHINWQAFGFIESDHGPSSVLHKDLVCFGLVALFDDNHRRNPHCFSRYETWQQH